MSSFTHNVEMQQANWFIGWPADRWEDSEALEASIQGLDLPTSSRPLVGTDRHVTLAFLGACGAPAAQRAFSLACEQAATMPAEVHATGLAWQLLGSPRAPSAVSLLLTAKHDSLAELIGTLRDNLYAAAQASPDSRPPKPHLTVARLARQLSQPRRGKIAAQLTHATPPNGRLVLDQLALFTWTEHRDQRLFQRVSTVSLGPVSRTAHGTNR